MIKREFVAGTLLILGACSKEVPIYPDFCKETGHTYTNREKIESALRYISANIQNPGLDYYKKSPRFMSFYEKNKGNPDVFVKYIDRFPDCCAVMTPPAYTEWYSAWHSNGATDREILGEPGEWVADVAVDNWRRGGPGAPELWPDFKVSDCNKISVIPRG